MIVSGGLPVSISRTATMRPLRATLKSTIRSPRASTPRAVPAEHDAPS
jgi:hypothetical protein